MEKSHLIAHFSGHVQGVGFRYQVREAAKGFNVTGYVKNLADGRVLMEAEGETTEVDGFLADIQDKLKDYIRNTEVKRSSDLKGSSDFTIR
jgi:acylphosphatase